MIRISVCRWTGNGNLIFRTGVEEETGLNRDWWLLELLSINHMSELTIPDVKIAVFLLPSYEKRESISVTENRIRRIHSGSCWPVIRTASSNYPGNLWSMYNIRQNCFRISLDDIVVHVSARIREYGFRIEHTSRYSCPGCDTALRKEWSFVNSNHVISINVIGQRSR